MKPTKSPALHPQSRSRSRSVNARWHEYTGDGKKIILTGDEIQSVDGSWKKSQGAGFLSVCGSRYRRLIPTAPVSPRASRKTAGKVKACRGHVMESRLRSPQDGFSVFSPKLMRELPHKRGLVPVAVIPLDDVEGLIDRAMVAYGDAPSTNSTSGRTAMIAALASLGIPIAQRGKRGAE